jgi:hypothetical protein
MVIYIEENILKGRLKEKENIFGNQEDNIKEVLRMG